MLVGVDHLRHEREVQSGRQILHEVGAVLEESERFLAGIDDVVLCIEHDRAAVAEGRRRVPVRDRSHRGVVMRDHHRHLVAGMVARGIDDLAAAIRAGFRIPLGLALDIVIGQRVMRAGDCAHQQKCKQTGSLHVWLRSVDGIAKHDGAIEE